MRSEYWDDKATQVVVAHPSKPQEVQRRFMQAARKAWSMGRRPIWTDVGRMKAWLMGRGAVVRERSADDTGVK